MQRSGSSRAATCRGVFVSEDLSSNLGSALRLSLRSRSLSSTIQRATAASLKESGSFAGQTESVKRSGCLVVGRDGDDGYGMEWDHAMSYLESAREMRNILAV